MLENVAQSFAHRFHQCRRGHHAGSLTVAGPGTDRVAHLKSLGRELGCEVLKALGQIAVRLEPGQGLSQTAGFASGAVAHRLVHSQQSARNALERLKRRVVEETVLAVSLVLDSKAFPTRSRLSTGRVKLGAGAPAPSDEG